VDDGPQTVAITFDDLPFAGATPGSAAKAAAVNRAITRILRRERVPAIGFVTERHTATLKSKGRSLIRDWIAAGFDVGNHGATHADINTLTIEEVRREIVDGEHTIRPLTQQAGRSLRFYRFAYNHVGETEEKRIAIENELASRGYQLAASTIDTSDYVFDRAHVRAKGNPVLRAKIEQAYLDHTRTQLRYYQALSRQVLGRTPPAILLLHANGVNAATLRRVIAVLRSEGMRFVSLADAQSDSAYAFSPKIATRFGPMWGYRWARERGVRVDGAKEQEPPAWVRQYGETGLLPKP
jgi:peptidoglycan/xylan/chitin deacetylase (PgdA/CDA1 family)